MCVDICTCVYTESLHFGSTLIFRLAVATFIVLPQLGASNARASQRRRSLCTAGLVPSPTNFSVLSLLEEEESQTSNVG